MFFSVQLFTMSCIISLIVQSYVTQGQGITRRYYNCQYYTAISRVGFPEAIKILTGSTKYQGIDGYFCEMFYSYCDGPLRTTKLSSPDDR